MMMTDIRRLIGPIHAHLDAPCTDACYGDILALDCQGACQDARCPNCFPKQTDSDKKLDEILRKVSAIEERMNKTEALVAGVVEEVKPTIDELMNSSFFKMLGMKKK